MADIMVWAAIAWLVWVACNFILMAAFSAFGECNSAHYDGFRVRIPAWLRTALTEREIEAFRQHEEGHRARMHVWKNFARVCLFVGMTPELRRRQEHEADDHCSDPAALASAIRKTSSHPFDLARAHRLESRVAAALKIMSDEIAKIPIKVYSEEGPAGCRRPNPRDAGREAEGDIR